jgi:glycosyltransferase involved in cell wall biosynthesis
MGQCFFEIKTIERPLNQPALLFVGHVGPRKGLLYLIEALAMLADHSVTLCVIGPTGSDYARTVRQRATASGISDLIEWLGVQNERGVADPLARSDLLVLPSFWGNMPMCIGEASAAGVPVVSTRAAGIPDWVDEGKAGLLVPPGNSADLANAIRTLLTDASLRQLMETAARAKALAQYSPPVVAEKTLRVYEDILSATGQPAGRNQPSPRLVPADS